VEVSDDERRRVREKHPAPVERDPVHDCGYPPGSKTLAIPRAEGF
jgi:hypothetical protein